MFRRKILVGIFFIVIILFSNISIVTNAQIEELSETNQEKSETEQLPDLAIVDVTGSNDMIDPYFKVHIKNVGEIPFTCEEGHRIKATAIVKKAFLPIVIAVEHNTQYSPFPQLDPGETYEHTVYAPYKLGIYRCYFEIDSDNYYEEENEDNNRAWAYFFLRYTWYPWPGGPWRLTKLRYWAQETIV